MSNDEQAFAGLMNKFEMAVRHAQMHGKQTTKAYDTTRTTVVAAYSALVRERDEARALKDSAINLVERTQDRCDCYAKDAARLDWILDAIDLVEFRDLTGHVAVTLTERRRVIDIAIAQRDGKDA